MSHHHWHGGPSRQRMLGGRALHRYEAASAVPNRTPGHRTVVIGFLRRFEPDTGVRLRRCHLFSIGRILSGCPVCRVGWRKVSPERIFELPASVAVQALVPWPHLTGRDFEWPEQRRQGGRRDWLLLPPVLGPGPPRQIDQTPGDIGRGELVSCAGVEDRLDVNECHLTVGPVWRLPRLSARHRNQRPFAATEALFACSTCARGAELRGRPGARPGAAPGPQATGSAATAGPRQKRPDTDYRPLPLGSSAGSVALQTPTPEPVKNPTSV
jgi:hypothetical protein